MSVNLKDLGLPEVNVSEELQPLEPVNHGGDQEAEEAMRTLMDSIMVSLHERDTKIAKLTDQLKLVAARMMVLENNVGYLLSQDPVIQAQIRATEQAEKDQQVNEKAF